MAQAPVDLLLLIEHAARELDVACVIKRLLTSRHGFSVAIGSIATERSKAIQAYRPRLVATPYYYAASDPDTGQLLRAWPEARYVNLAYEQVYHRLNLDFKAPRDEFARQHVRYLAWGEFFAQYLQQHGVPAGHIMVTGSPGHGLYHPPYADVAPSRETLAARHGLNPSVRWVFVPENYAAAFYSDGLLRHYIRRGYSTPQAHRFRAFAQEAFLTVAGWWRELALSGAVELIVRPKPATPLALFRQAYQAAAGRQPPRLHIIKEGTAREWILASDVVASSYSTTLIEGALAQKPVYMVTPVALPEFLEAEWYQFVPKITHPQALIDAATEGPRGAPWEPLRRWALAHVLAEGDPLVNAGEALASLLKEGQDAPPSLDGFRARSWSAALFSDAPRRLWRELSRGARANQHEQDRLTETDVDRCCARWAAVVDEMAGALV